MGPDKDLGPSRQELGQVLPKLASNREIGVFLTDDFQDGIDDFLFLHLVCMSVAVQEGGVGAVTEIEADEMGPDFSGALSVADSLVQVAYRPLRQAQFGLLVPFGVASILSGSCEFSA